MRTPLYLVVGFLGLLGCSGSDDESSDQTEDAVVEADPAASAPRTGTFKATLDGRVFAAHVPTTYTGETPVPLVVHFHGWRSVANVGNEIAAVWKPTAEANGFIAIAPEGASCPELNPSGTPFLCFKNGVDDAFVAKLIERMAGRYNIDMNRIYLSGHSGGSFYVQGFGLRHPEAFAAAVEFSGGCIKNSDNYGNSCSVYERVLAAESEKIPFFLVHNPPDQVVQQKMSKDLFAVLTAAGNPVKTHFDPYNGGTKGHSIDPTLVPEVWQWLKGFSRPVPAPAKTAQ